MVYIALVGTVFEESACDFAAAQDCAKQFWGTFADQDRDRPKKTSEKTMGVPGTGNAVEAVQYYGSRTADVRRVLPRFKTVIYGYHVCSYCIITAVSVV
jgi:hypothetical protein